MVGVSASVNLLLHHKVQKFLLFWHRLARVVPEKDLKRLWCGSGVVLGCITALVRCSLLIQQTEWHCLLLGQSVFNDPEPCRNG